jgi:hypothetical protein
LSRVCSLLLALISGYSLVVLTFPIQSNLTSRFLFFINEKNSWTSTMMEQAGEDTNFFLGLVQENLLLYLKSVTTEFIWIGCLCECEKISLFNWSVGAQPFFAVMSYASLVCSDCTLDLSWNAGPPLWSRWWSDALWATTLTRWWLHLLSCYVQSAVVEIDFTVTNRERTNTQGFNWSFKADTFSVVDNSSVL